VQWLQQLKFSGYIILVAIIGSTVLHFFSGKKVVIRTQQAIFILIAVGFTYGSYQWGSTYRSYAPSRADKGLAYKSAQLWAHDNTEISSVFMVDPCQSYGWRDYSARSSFGTVQEWYKTGWLYGGSQKFLHEGIKRGASLGIEVDKLSPKDEPNNVGRNVSRFCSVARKAFYQPDGEILKGITSDYDIQYVVMDKVQATKFGAIPKWKKSFENKHYVVLIPPHEQKS